MSEQLLKTYNDAAIAAGNRDESDAHHQGLLAVAAHVRAETLEEIGRLAHQNEILCEQLATAVETVAAHVRAETLNAIHEVVNAEGGTFDKENAFECGYDAAIGACLMAIERLGGRDPLSVRAETIEQCAKIAKQYADPKFRPHDGPLLALKIEKEILTLGGKQDRALNKGAQAS